MAKQVGEIDGRSECVMDPVMQTFSNSIASHNYHLKALEERHTDTELGFIFLFWGIIFTHRKMWAATSRHTRRQKKEKKEIVFETR